MTNEDRLDQAAPPSTPWPAPHPVIDAPYGPRYRAPEPPPVPDPPGRRAGWDLTPMEPTPRSTRWLVVFTAICTVVAALGAYVGYRFVTDDRFPSRWDRRVEDLVAFVERDTGLEFAHPVRIRFLDDEAFNKLVSNDEESLTDEQRRALANEEALGRAFGWYTGTTDVFDEQNTLATSSVIALYSYGSREIVARSNDEDPATLSVGLRATVVHELVHALQDQRLDVRKLQSNAKGIEEQTAASSLIEGHAVYVEQHYLRSLSEAELSEYQRYLDSVTGSANQATKDVARAISASLQAPYVIGPPLVAAAALTKAGVKQLYVRPPVAQDQFLDPQAYFDRDLPGSVERPKVTGTTIPAGIIGPVRLYLTLAAAMPPADAWEAALAWDNDSYAGARATKDAPLCISWNITADGDAQARTLRSALTRWAASRVKEATVSVSAEDSPINVTMCDPGTKVPQQLISEAAVDYLFMRANILGELIEASGSTDVAQCATDEVMRTETVEDLQQADDALRARVMNVLATCRS